MNASSPIACAVALVLSSGASLMGAAYDPVANPKAVVTSGNARFTVLTPRLVRMEYAPDGVFEDRASYAFVNRNTPVTAFTKGVDAGVLTIKTPFFTLRYTEGKPFDATSLRVEFRDMDGKTRTWTPGTENRGDLKGTWRTLDGVSGASPLEPGLLSREGWTFVDDSRRTLLDNSDWPWATSRPQKDAFDGYLFIYGTNYAQALRDFTSVAGRIPLPPRYAFGAWWSRYWAYSDAELRQLVKDFREHDVPLDVLVVDMDWHLDGWTGYTWNPKYFPDPKGFLDWCHQQGLHVTLNLHPAEGVGKHEAAFKDVCAALGLDPEKTERVPFNSTDRRYVEAYFKHLHHPLEQMGVDFWWMDWQQGKETDVPGLDPLPWLNYLHWTDWERNPGVKPSRPLVFSRWGGLGNHRYQIGFSGDTFCNWPSLAFQPYFTATAGNVGYSYWSHDIGGHQPGPVDPELYVRWIQWGALSPILRTHTTKNPAAERRIWAFPREFFESARAAYHLRYSLIPYIYTACRKTYDTGLPLCRPLYYAWPDREDAYAERKAYMFGDDLLAAPVVEPINPATRTAAVEFWAPPGRWTHWFTGQRLAGPKRVCLPTPLGQIPLFAADGAIIPLAPKMSHTGERPVDPLILECFPGASGVTRVYEDDGVSNDYQRGGGASTPVKIKRDAATGRATIEIGPTDGSFQGMPAQRSYEIRLRDTLPPKAATLNNRPAAWRAAGLPGLSYDRETLTTVLRTTPLSVTDPAVVTLDFAPLDAAVQQAFAGGLRGQMELLRRPELRAPAGQPDPAAALLTALTPAADGTLPASAAETATAAIKDLQKAWPEYVKRAARAALPPAERNELLTRLLGLCLRLDLTVREDAAAGGPPKQAVEAALNACVSPPPGASGDVAVDATLSVSSALRPIGTEPSRKSEQTDNASCVNVSQRFVPVAVLQTALMSGEVKLKVGGEEIAIPIERAVLPSINGWWVLGPLDKASIPQLDAELPGLSSVPADREYAGKDGKTARWRRVVRELRPGDDAGTEFFVNFSDVFGGRVYETVAFALVFLESPRAQPAVLRIGSDDGVVAWLNGKEVHRNEGGRAYTSKEDRAAVELRSGTNVLLLRVDQGVGDWGFGVHLEGPDGRPLPDVSVKLAP